MNLDVIVNIGNKRTIEELSEKFISDKIYNDCTNFFVNKSFNKIPINKNSTYYGEPCKRLPVPKFNSRDLGKKY